jgi:hypothetical protein
VQAENGRRGAKDKIALEYVVYPGDDHDLTGHLAQVWERDAAFLDGILSHQ